MANKPLDFLNRIPSVSELLEKQPVRSLTDRWNRSLVAAGVRSFLDELRADVRRRAAEMPSLRELAERAAQYVVSQQQSAPKTFINATGRILGMPWIGAPLPELALERTLATWRDFVPAPNTLGNTPGAANELEALLCRLTGGQSAVAVHSYAGGLWLAFAVLAANREVLVSRAEVGDVDAITPLPRLAEAAGASLKDVGTANRATIADYEAAVSPRSALLLKLSFDEYRIVGETAATELEELVALTGDRKLVLACAAGAAPLIDPPASFRWPYRSVRAILAAGADLVVVRASGLLGGPPCGILLGRQDILERIVSHPLYAAWQLDPFRAAALVGTLQCYESISQSQPVLPLWQLLSTPLENLRNRAERIAPQLASAPDIASATPVEVTSPLTAVRLDSGEWPSYGVSVVPQDGNMQALETRLSSGHRVVLGRIENDRLVLDLRTVFPRQDTMLVEAIAAGANADESSEKADEPTQ